MLVSWFGWSWVVVFGELLGLACGGQAKDRAVLRGHDKVVWSVAFSPDGGTLASGSEDGTVMLWDVATGKRRNTLKGHMGDVFAAAFSPDGRVLASGGIDGTIRLWDVASGKETSVLRTAAFLYAVAFRGDGQLLASAGGIYDKREMRMVASEIRLWSFPKGKECLTVRGHPDIIQSLSFSPDGRSMASASKGGAITVWEVATGKQRVVLRGPRGELASWVHTVIFLPDGKTLVSGSQDGRVRLWDLMSGKPKAELKGHRCAVSCVACSPDGKFLATVGGDKIGEIHGPEAKLWNLDTGQAVDIKGHTDVINAVAFSPDGRIMATASDDKTIRLFEILTSKRPGEMR